MSKIKLVVMSFCLDLLGELRFQTFHLSDFAGAHLLDLRISNQKGFFRLSGFESSSFFSHFPIP